MESLRQVTVDTYNQSAAAMAEYFKGIGSREDDVEITLKLAGNPVQPRIVEIGCGDGRDAAEIVPRAGWYEGIDISEGMIELACQKVPEGNFKVADVMEYEFPAHLDAVIAFASLLHLSREEIQATMQRVHKALRPEGIFFVSLKHAKEYREEFQEDRFGRRLFYFYNPKLIGELAKPLFEVVYTDTGFVTGGSTQWFEMALQKQ